MDQVKIGEFLKTLRKEKGLTQEQLAEQFNVSRRTVSRWETGNNMPDLDILIQLADYYEIDLRGLLDGERKSRQADNELEETILKVVEYNHSEKEVRREKTNNYFMMGAICFLLVILHYRFQVLEMIFANPLDEFVAVILVSLGMFFELIGFHNNGKVSLKQRKQKFMEAWKDMKGKSKIIILLLLGYCVPYIFLGMYVDFMIGSIGSYVLAIGAMTALSIYCKKSKYIWVAVVGNILTFISSYLFTAWLATEEWSYYFKAFPATLSTIYFSLAILLIQITVLVVTKEKSKT